MNQVQRERPRASETEGSPLPSQFRDAEFDPNALRLGAKLFHERTLKSFWQSKKAAFHLAEHVWGIAFSGGFPIAWVEAAIDDAAGEILASQIAGEKPSLKAVCQTVIRYARRPRRPRTYADEGGENSAEAHREIIDAEQRSFRQRVAAEEATAVRKPEAIKDVVGGVLRVLEGVRERESVPAPIESTERPIEEACNG